MGRDSPGPRFLSQAGHGIPLQAVPNVSQDFRRDLVCFDGFGEHLHRGKGLTVELEGFEQRKGFGDQFEDSGPFASFRVQQSQVEIDESNPCHLFALDKSEPSPRIEILGLRRIA